MRLYRGGSRFSLDLTQKKRRYGGKDATWWPSLKPETDKNHLMCKRSSLQNVFIYSILSQIFKPTMITNQYQSERSYFILPIHIRNSEKCSTRAGLHSRFGILSGAGKSGPWLGDLQSIYTNKRHGSERWHNMWNKIKHRSQWKVKTLIFPRTKIDGTLPFTLTRAHNLLLIICGDVTL